ncbi:MAG: tetratricopeptide repeat protein, partial [Actinomycetota bacterium]|nr:tetratricopeptide repeat protein [Actinomycetota bacterium]
LVVFLDDLQWADESSVLLLQNVAHGLANIPVLVLGTYRNVELDVYRPFGRVLDNLVRQRLVHRIALKRLSEEGVRTMLERLGGEEPPEALARAIYEETDGNAFFVEEVFRHLAEEGRLFDHQGRWRTNIDIDELEVPESVRLVIGRRLQGLSARALKALGAAAVLGRTFDYEVLETLQEVGADELLEAIEEAQRLSLVQPLSDSPTETRYEFVHELIRQTLLGGMSVPRRRRLHSRIARALEKVYADDVEDRAPEIVEHLMRGGGDDPQMTLRYLLLAGARAQESAAFEDALRYYQEALDLVDPSDDRAAAQVQLGLARAERSLGRFDEALTHWHQAFAAYERLEDVQAIAEVATEVVLQVGWAGRWVDVVETAARGLAAIGERENPERAVLLAFAAIGLGWAGGYETSKSMMDQAVDLASRVGDKELLGEVLAGHATHLFAYAFVSQSVDVGLEACDLLRQSKAQWNYASALAFVCFGLAALSRFDEALSFVDELAELSTRLGFGGGVMFAHRVRQIEILSTTGDLATMEKLAYEDLDICRRYDLPWIGQSHIFIARVKFLAGDRTAAVDARRGVELDQPGAIAGWGEATLFRILGYEGNRGEAIEAWKQLEPYLPQLGMTNAIGRWSVVADAIDGWYVLGDREKVAEFYPIAEQATTLEIPMNFDRRTHFCSAGIAAGAAGRWDESEAFFDRALQLAEHVGARIEALDVRRFHGAMLLDRGGPGDRRRAAALLQEALNGYELVGIRPYLSITKEWLRRAE